jgi:Arc/MetJ family transcription regulator
MRTNIVIDDELMNEAIALSGARSKREAVELALQKFVKILRQAEIKQYRGKLNWVGDLDAMRTD